MDRQADYRRIIKQVLYDHAQIGYSHGEIERLAICDAANNSYLLLAIGWDGNRRVHSVVFHLRIRCLLYTSPSPRDRTRYRMPSSP